MNIPKWIMKPVSIIPKGSYCSGMTYRCPYHTHKAGRDEQEDGYCEYLEVGDYERNRDENVRYINREGNSNTAYEIGLPFSLLWDGCKECGVNDDWEDYAEGDAELIR